MSLYIFVLYNFYHLCFTCIDFYDLSARGGCWFVVYIRRFIYKFLNVCPFDYTAVAGSGKVGPVDQVNHTSWVAVVNRTDRPKSGGNRCVIDFFVALFVLSLCPFYISVGVGAFVIGLGLISSFLSFRNLVHTNDVTLYRKSVYAGKSKDWFMLALFCRLCFFIEKAMSVVSFTPIKNFYDVTYCVFSMDRWTNQPVAVDL